MKLMILFLNIYKKFRKYFKINKYRPVCLNFSLTIKKQQDGGLERSI